VRVPYTILQFVNDELVEQELWEKESDKIHPSKRKEQKTDG
jgi:hypothetical protein